MPRPGPRPYECVKRAWHSDMHQPIRGSIIQKIFRAVHERHSAVTKKNTEWQIKLPIVVFKAEEIMYSKANSEAEYMDPDTLWDRANEAIDVIIRRDESTETGQLLPPCVEAALVLGCVAERTSRSQRNCKPRNYLSPRAQEPCPVPPKVFNPSSNEHNPNSLSPHSSSQPTFRRPAHLNLVTLASESNKSIAPNINSFSASSVMNQILHAEGNAPVSMGSVYPLYNGTGLEPKVTQTGFREPHSNVIVGKPIYPSTMEPAEVNCFQSLFPKYIDNHAQDERAVLSGGPQEECDLSLRLGQSLDHGLHLGMASASGGPNLRPSDDSNERGKSKVISTINDRDFCFFRAESTNDPSRLPTSWRNPEGEGQDMESILRKRKMPFHNAVDNSQFFSQEGRTFNHFTGQMKRPGL